MRAAVHVVRSDEWASRPGDRFMTLLPGVAVHVSEPRPPQRTSIGSSATVPSSIRQPRSTGSEPASETIK